MAGQTRRTLQRAVWRRITRLLRRRPEPVLLPLPPDPPDDEPALVPGGSPKRPRPAGAIALELPEPPQDVEATGRSVD